MFKMCPFECSELKPCLENQYGMQNRSSSYDLVIQWHLKTSSNRPDFEWKSQPMSLIMDAKKSGTWMITANFRCLVFKYQCTLKCVTIPPLEVVPVLELLAHQFCLVPKSFQSSQPTRDLSRRLSSYQSSCESTKQN